MRVKTALISSIFVLILLALTGMGLAGADDMTENAGGIKATLKIDVSKGMAELYLADLDTSKAVTGAKVGALITNPAGRKEEKALMYMKMGEVVPYMSMLDLSRKGRYIFDVTAESGKKKARFHFTYEVK